MVLELQEDPQARALRRTYASAAMALLVVAGLLYAAFVRGRPSNTAWLLTTIVMVGLALLLVSVGNLHVSRNANAEGDRSLDADRDLGTRNEAPDMTAFSQVARLNQRLIGSYHGITTAQARSAFRNSQIAMAVGLVILVGGGAVALRATDNPAGQVIVGVLAALGSAFSAYLGATFLASYNRALQQMNYYYGQPLVNSYLLTAERLSKELSDAGARDQSLREVIASTLEGARQASGAIDPVEPSGKTSLLPGSRKVGGSAGGA